MKRSESSGRAGAREHLDAVMLGAALAVSAGLVLQPGRSPALIGLVAVLVAASLALRVRSAGGSSRRELNRWRHLAAHDALTGLPNRLTFVERLDRTWGNGRPVAVLYIDLDGFKEVNDRLGHSAGDDLLVEVASRLSAEVRNTDVVARFGGDEFVAFLDDCSSTDAHEVAHRLVEVLGFPYLLGDQEVRISASVGVCPPGACDGPGDALRAADVALYQAKGAGRDCVREYVPGAEQGSANLESAGAELASALADGRLRLVYLPEIDLGTGTVTSVEALVRVDTRDGVAMPLDLLLPAARACGLESDLTEWVLGRALADCARWRVLGWHGRVSVNVTAAELAGGGLPQQVGRLLAKHGLDGRVLSLEFSETSFSEINEINEISEISEDTARSLDLLRDMGVATVLDDFGSGPRSMALLRDFPWDVLKVDHSLVAREGGLPAPLARLYAGLGHMVVAEGIETPAQLVEQRAAGVRKGQGHLLAAPLRGEDVEPVLTVGRVVLPG